MDGFPMVFQLDLNVLGNKFKGIQRENKNKNDGDTDSLVESFDEFYRNFKKEIF